MLFTAVFCLFELERQTKLSSEKTFENSKTRLLIPAGMFFMSQLVPVQHKSTKNIASIYGLYYNYTVLLYLFKIERQNRFLNIERRALYLSIWITTRL